MTLSLKASRYIIAQNMEINKDDLFSKVLSIFQAASHRINFTIEQPHSYHLIQILNHNIINLFN